MNLKIKDKFIDDTKTGENSKIPITLRNVSWYVWIAAKTGFPSLQASNYRAEIELVDFWIE